MARADISRPYAGARIALGSMHAKEHAIAKPFSRLLGAEIVVPADIDTDQYGTFTGEIDRYGTMLDAARAKARLAMHQSGLPLGVASEGSYGPHPYLPLLPGGRELLLLIDDALGIEVREAIVVHRTNYDNLVCAPGDKIDAFLQRIGFPSHALIVNPHAEIETPALRLGRNGHVREHLRTRLGEAGPILFKGITDRPGLEDAIEAAASVSMDGKARLTPDIRAHLNPTRMAMIRAVAVKLAQRLARLCPQCVTPGFGVVDIARGLPCRACGTPTQLVVAEIQRCAKCAFETTKPTRLARTPADPAHCEHCNP